MPSLPAMPCHALLCHPAPALASASTATIAQFKVHMLSSLSIVGTVPD